MPHLPGWCFARQYIHTKYKSSPSLTDHYPSIAIMTYQSNLNHPWLFLNKDETYPNYSRRI